MPQRLKQYPNLESFLASLSTKTKSKFETEVFKAEAYRENDKSAHREFKLLFFEKREGKWVDYGFIISPYRADLKEALQEELAIYSPKNKKAA